MPARGFAAPPAATLKWRLMDSHTQYGILLATLPAGRLLSHDQQQLVDTLCEQLTATLALDRHQEKQQQLIVMEERSTIARRRCTTIAQSLSCMKMQVGYYKCRMKACPRAANSCSARSATSLTPRGFSFMSCDHLPFAAHRAGAASCAGVSCQEFSARLGFPVKLDYQLPPRFIPLSPGDPLAARLPAEALSNVLKHAEATAVTVTVSCQDNQVKLRVQDNGRGVPENAERTNHYGLIIMRDRAQSLRGDYQVRRGESGGTEVVVTFIPEKPLITAQRRKP